MGETLDLTYKINGSYNQESLSKIFHLLRSPEGEERPIDTKLIDALDTIQDHFNSRCVEIISGYRSRAYNKKLKDEGRRVANESLHIEGQAIDIHIDEVTDEALRDYSKGLGLGGVGYYPNHNFVHIDSGPVKYWSAAPGERKLMGLGEKPPLTTLISDKNVYFSQNDVRFELNDPVSPKVRNFRSISIERFECGTWREFSRGELADGGLKSKTELLPGRYRVRLNDVLSNEFYIKMR